MSGVDHCDVIKGFCRLKSVLIAGADMLCHRDMNHILRFCQLLREKPLVVLHLRRLGIACSPLCNVGQQLIWRQLLAIQEAALLCADVVWADRNTKLPEE